ncbi:hypothetical protein MTR67_043006 [Solanum verrucosum]|uniref:Cullin family profile domain-containing protein n=1 Tax=Solanum verrucosum TaxID=315347 RepID=A0AAF0ZSA6_SOLVR|nr:hypothetical protein MTR67_043006 [Solanum verrucosum]
MLKAEKCLKKEKDRVSHYLHVVSKTKLLEKVQYELLVVYTNQLLENEHSGCRVLLRDDDKAEDTTNSKSETPFFVRKLVELYDMAYVTNCFANNSIFHKALNEAFKVFYNKIVSGFSSAELLASYCDNILKKGESVKLSDDAIEETLDKVVKLLAYIIDKDLVSEKLQDNKIARLKLKIK